MILILTFMSNKYSNRLFNLSKLTNPNKYIKGVKFIFWFLLPYFSTLFYKIKWSFFKKVVIVPHFGLGDIAVLVPAIKEFEKKFDKIYIAGNKDYITSILILFNFSDKIKIIDIEINEIKYLDRFSNIEKSKFSEFGKVIFLGSFDNDPIINYPSSFFIKMGIPSRHILKQYDLNKDFLMKNKTLKDLLHKLNSFIYINASTSKGFISLENKIVHFNNYETVISYGKSASLFGIKDFLDTNSLKIESNIDSIIINVFLCLLADKSIISDAGLFNIVIKFKKCKELIVVTRAHKHSHNNLLYKIQFNGKIQSRSAN